MLQAESGSELRLLPAADFKEEDMVEVAELISLIIKDFEGNKDDVKKRVQALCDKHPLYA